MYDNYNRFLCRSSFIFLIPIIIFLRKTKKNIYETLLAMLLLINFGLSWMFWRKAVKHSNIHFIDAGFARLSPVLFSIYILFIKDISVVTKTLFIFVVCVCFVIWYFSHINSSHEWCCKEHIFYHCLFHICTCIATMFAFI